MSTTTTNYNLVKPELSDAADITAMNSNWDKIDTMLKNLTNEGWLTPVTTENQNLDNYVTQGIYSFDSAYAPINRPDGNSNGWLIVIPWNNTPGVGTVKQLWLRHGALNSNDHCLYVRTRISSDNAWSTWAQIYTTKDITVNLADINALGTTIAQVNNIGNALDEKAPINHASSSDTYGKGTDTNYGHVKLSNSTTSTSGTSGGTAATPAAVKAAYDLADGKQDSLTFDNMPTQNSDNPVKSGGVFSALANKQDSLTFDNTPTENSANPVKSGGVFSALSTLGAQIAGKVSAEDIGNLWVWRKTVVTKDPVPEVPGSYTLGSAAITNLARMTSNGYNGYAADILVSKEIKVNLDGSVELVSPTSRQMVVSGSSESYRIDVNSDELLGAGNRYFTPSKDSNHNSSRCTLLIPPGTVYYVAPGTTYTTAERSIGFTSAFNAAQLVTGVPGTPAIPAGTTTTYPVSTNPNAYQEGDDAKPAGYTLGEVETGSFQMAGSNSSGYVNAFRGNDTVKVSDDGSISIGTESGFVSVNVDRTSSAQRQARSLVGKFIQNDSYVAGDFLSGETWFIPTDATISDYVYVNKRQRVTGYAAIPASTTIEYLGKLGDKAMVQVVSYVGTGTYGSSNPNSVTFRFKPKIIFWFLAANMAYGYALDYTSYLNVITPIEFFTTEYKAYKNPYIYYNKASSGYAKISEDGKTISWYHTVSASDQNNTSGTKYYCVAIG